MTHCSTGQVLPPCQMPGLSNHFEILHECDKQTNEWTDRFGIAYSTVMCLITIIARFPVQ